MLKILFIDHTAVLSGAGLSMLNLVPRLDRTRFAASVVLFADGPLAGALREAKAVLREAAEWPENTPDQRDLFQRYYPAWHAFRGAEKITEARISARQWRLPEAARLSAQSLVHLLLSLRR
jgi:hypothetical protein